MANGPGAVRGQYQSIAAANLTSSDNVTDRKAREMGQVSTEPHTLSAPDAVLVTDPSAVLVAAAAGTGRFVTIKVPHDAVDGICLNFGAAATTSKWRMYPGEVETFSTEQDIHAIRAGATDVTVYTITGVAS